MKTRSKITLYIVHSIAAAALLLTAQISVAGSATWLSTPQDSAWENPNNWTPGGPPNGPSDIATFAHSSQTAVNISSSVEVNRIVFTSGSDSFHFSISGGELVISGTGIHDNDTVSQTFSAGDAGRIMFNHTSTAGHATITSGADFAAHVGGQIIFNDSSTAESATLVATGGYYGAGGEIFLNDTSTGGTASVKVFEGSSANASSGSLNISRHQSGVTIGSIEGSGNVSLGPNNLTVGTNNINTAFSGVISNNGRRGTLTKIGRGGLTLQTNNSIADSVGLILVSNSFIKLDFAGPPDVIASLKVNGVSQPPGIYGGPLSGAPHILPEFRGSGTIHVRPSALVNISTRAFVETGENVMIGGFIIEGPNYKEVLIRAIGPELTQYGVPNPLANPRLELHDATGALIASNDDWQHTIIGGIITFDQVDWIRSTGHAPTDRRESAMAVVLPPGNYTTIVRGTDNRTGVALVEVYDRIADLYPNTRDTVLGNVSTRSFVQTGGKVMIGGFIIEGSGPKKVIMRAIGPELTQHGVSNALADPALELYNAAGVSIASNDNWMTTLIGGIITSDQVNDIMDSAHAPTDPSESAIIATLPPGNYTAIVRGVNNTTGVGLVEVYDLD